MNILIDLIRDTTPSDIGTLFLHDPLTNELYSHVTHPEPVDIAMPAHLGIAGIYPILAGNFNFERIGVFEWDHY